MTERRFNTLLRWHDSRGEECEVTALVIYKCHPGFKGDLTDPPEDAGVEITGIRFPDKDTDIPSSLWSDPELIAECHEHWANDEAAAAEYRAEQRADHS